MGLQFTANPREYAFELSLRVITHFMNVRSRITEVSNRADDKPHTVIVERSADTQMRVFVTRAREQKLIDDMQMDVLTSIYAMIPIPFDKRIFVNTSVETCLKRIQMRGRYYEQSSGKEYSQDLHTRMGRNYQSLHQEQCAYKTVIDGELNPDEMKARLVEIVNDTEDR